MQEIISIKKFQNDREYRTIGLTIISGIFLVISRFGWLKPILPFDAAWFSIVISGTPWTLSGNNRVYFIFGLS
jgi:hypothetical protein